MRRGAEERGTAMKDRFTDAIEELAEKNPYICESCNTESGKTMTGHREVEAKTREEHEGGLHVVGLDIGGTRLERTIYSDPTPFGA